jgi:polyisoprenoid-binding protein YceI
VSPLVRSLVVLALLAVAPGAGGRAGEALPAWTSSAARGEIVVHVFRRGLLSGLAHDHHFVATDWQATAWFDPASPTSVRVELVVTAGSLRDRQEALSAEEREQVRRRAAGPDTLDAVRFPEVRFAGWRLAPIGQARDPREQVLEGSLQGALTVRGVERPLALPVRVSGDGAGWRVTGSVRFKQSDFGITPFSGFLGTVSVHDQVAVEYDLRLEPEGVQADPSGSPRYIPAAEPRRPPRRPEEAGP